jgi:anti-anti-sigma factor
MNAGNMTVTLTQPHGNTMRIILAGEMQTQADMLILESGIRQIDKHAVRNIVFDCAQLDYINSYGINLFIKIKRSGFNVTVQSPTHFVYQVLAITKATNVIDVNL